MALFLFHRLRRIRTTVAESALSCLGCFENNPYCCGRTVVGAKPPCARLIPGAQLYMNTTVSSNVSTVYRLPLSLPFGAGILDLKYHTYVIAITHGFRTTLVHSGSTPP